MATLTCACSIRIDAMNIKFARVPACPRAQAERKSHSTKGGVALYLTCYKAIISNNKQRRVLPAFICQGETTF